MPVLATADWVALGTGLGTFLVVLLVWQALVERDPLAGRLKAVTQRRAELQAQMRPAAKPRKERQRPVALIKQLVGRLQLVAGAKEQELRLKLMQAGIRSRDALPVFAFSKLAIALGLGVVVAFFLYTTDPQNLKPAQEMMLALGAALAGFFLPDVWLKNEIDKRLEKLRKQLPDSLDLLVICAEAGLSLDAALDRVSREVAGAAPELAEEVGITSVELGFMPDRQQALRGLADRVALPGAMALVNTLIQTEKYGTPLAQALRVLSAEQRDERMMRAEEKAARLPAILTVPMILFILPPLFVVLIGPAILRAMDVVGGMGGG